MCNSSLAILHKFWQWLFSKRNIFKALERVPRIRFLNKVQYQEKSLYIIRNCFSDIFRCLCVCWILGTLNEICWFFIIGLQTYRFWTRLVQSMWFYCCGKRKRTKGRSGNKSRTINFRTTALATTYNSQLVPIATWPQERCGNGKYFTFIHWQWPFNIYIQRWTSNKRILYSYAIASLASPAPWFNLHLPEYNRYDAEYNRPDFCANNFQKIKRVI